ncbi:hypothetical protein D4764_05G0010920 [Takifugu flavidus]|uniref:Uncharacterized protein n=1 Tax=Takifugu flavidus TaxID=433684 RepID=A0A5C6N0L6_9TELE|nr:hypothetical protein D4764_05G0010920 [Takifugu flavidus]
MVSRRGKVIATDGVDLPEGNITDMQDSYKYLGIPQASGNHEEAARCPEFLRLYTKRKEGGQGLVSVRTTVQEETTSLREYIKMMAPSDPLLSECLRQQKPTKEEEPEGLSWKDKPMHGMYHRQIEEVADIEKTYQWLTKAGLKDSTEALLMAVQEQALSTRAIEARVYHTRQEKTRGADCVEMPLRQSSTSQQGVLDRNTFQV